MTTKVKGLLKGLRYISQIFDEEKEQEIQIGFPTDVKHVAHIGWDGPAVESPSWMKEFSSSTGFQSAPLGPPIDSKDNPEIKWVSEDSKRGHRAARSPGSDPPELPKASRRNSSTENDSPRKKDSSTRSRQSRRNQPKDSSDGSGAPKSGQESGPTLPDIPRKSRRKKSKESDGGGGSTRSRSKGTTSNGTSQDAGGPDSGVQTPNVDDGETEIRGNSKE